MLKGSRGGVENTDKRMERKSNEKIKTHEKGEAVAVDRKGAGRRKNVEIESLSGRGRGASQLKKRHLGDTT